MLAIDRVRAEAHRMPALTKGGVVALGFAGLLDLIAHFEANEHVGHLHQHTSAEASGHLAAFVSMVLIYLGVVLDGARQQRARRHSAERSSKGVA